MAPRDDDKAMDGLLRRSLARDAARGAAREINCPEPDILAAYSEQSLDADETAHFELHFSTCPKCREQLAAIFRTQSVRDVPAEVEVLARAAGPRAVAYSPAAAAAPTATKSAPQPRSWTIHLRWVAPVAAVLILAAVVSWQRGARVAHAPAAENQVAMSRPEAAQKSLADQPTKQYDAIPPAAPPAELKTQLAQRGRLEADKQPAPSNSHLAGALSDAKRVPTAPNRLQSRTRADLDAAYSQSQQADNLRTNDQFQQKVKSRRTSDDMSASLEKSARAQAPPPANAPAPAQTVNSLDEAPKAATSTVEVYSAAPAVAVPAPPSAAPQPKSEAAPAGAPSMTTTESVRAGKMAKEKKDAPQAAGGVAGATGGGVSAGIGGYANSKSAVVDVRSGAAPVIQSQDANVQYRIGGGARIERSDDSGATWQGQRMKAASQILAGAAPSENVCWLVGRAGAILLTTDGKTWKKISPPADADFVAVTAADASAAAVTTSDGRTFRTSDGGQSWQVAK
jgi:hypothetical protein